MKINRLFILVLASFIGMQCSNEPPKKPTVFVVGDSTVKNGRGDGAGGLWGWGDFIGQLLDTTKVNVENHARGGTSSRTYQDKGLWDSVHKKLKKGDYVLIQFGHNDDGPINDDFRARGTIKGIGDEAEEIDNMLTGKHEIVHSYGWYIRKLVVDTKDKGAIPIIMSPIPRNQWEGGKIPRNNTSYGLWAHQVAEQEGTTFIDLNDNMAKKLEGLGEDKVTGTYFYKRDHTHTSARGAVLAASIIANELAQTDNPIREFILDDPEIILPRKKNIFLIGDSTMADNSDENAVGWGVPFPKFVDTTRMNVFNKARGGRSSRTFLYEGLWDSVKAQLQPDDFVLIQFGHNDAGNIDQEKYRGSLKGIGDQTQEVIRPDGTKEIVHTFGWYMKKYIRETKALGAEPIVLSLTPRNEWPKGEVEQRQETYVKWARQAAEMENALYLDISDSLAVSYKKLGKGKVKDFFPKDHTHTGWEGAEFNAMVIAESLENLKTSDLSNYIFISEK